MKHSSSRDARSMPLRYSISFPLGTMVTYVTWSVPLRELELRRALGKRDIHAARLANPCLVWKSTTMARVQKSQEWLANLCQEPDECEGRRPSCSIAVAERPWRPPYLSRVSLDSQRRGEVRGLEVIG